MQDSRSNFNYSLKFVREIGFEPICDQLPFQPCIRRSGYTREFGADGGT